MMNAQTKQAAIKHVIGEASKAREQSPFLYLELYCDGTDCPVRELLVRVKDHDSTFVKLIQRQGGFRCSLCGGWAKLHYVITADSQEENEERAARISCNVQMFVRDLKKDDPDRFVLVDASKYTDDRLPPTPEGWFGTSEPVQRRRFIRGDEQ